MRYGFTLIEVLVALVIFEFGMLALVATSGVMARTIALAQRRTQARALATGRVEQLRLRACFAPESGTSSAPGGVTETWSVVVSGPRRDISDSVSIAAGAGRSAFAVVRSTVLCAP